MFISKGWVTIKISRVQPNENENYLSYIRICGRR